METAPSDSPRDGVKPGADPAADAAAAQPEPPVIQPEIQLAQAEPPPAPAPETGRTAAAGSAENGESVERGSVLQEFLADGPPQVEADGEQAGGERRPVQMQQDEEQPQETEAPGEAPPVETAADAEVPQTSGTSFYEDDLGGLRDTLPDVADDPTVPQNADPLLVEQISDPLVLASAAVATGGATLDVVVPPPAPVPDEPINNPDPLTERELAEGDAGGANGSSGGDDEAVFSFSLTADEGDNVVTDFDAASDTLQITDVIDLNADSAIDFADLDAGGSTVSGTAGSVDIALAGGTTIVLQGVDGSGLDSFEDLNGSINLDVVA
jgi:hypothetical protein